MHRKLSNESLGSSGADATLTTATAEMQTNGENAIDTTSKDSTDHWTFSKL